MKVIDIARVGVALLRERGSWVGPGGDQLMLTGPFQPTRPRVIRTGNAPQMWAHPMALTHAS